MSQIIDDIKSLILTESDKQKLLNSSAYALPADPTAKGWGAEAIKNKLYVPSLLIYEWLLKTQNTLQELAEDSDTYYVNSLDLQLDTTTYKLTIKGLNKNGVVLDTKEVDFPSELSVISIAYDNGTKNLTYTLRDNSKIDVSLKAIYDYVDTETTRAKSEETRIEEKFDLAIEDLSGVDANIKNDLASNYPTKLSFELDHSTYQLTIKLLNKNNTILDSKMVDFPTESSITNIEYIESSKSLKFTLRNGNTTLVPLEAILTGLATEKYVNDKESSLDTKIAKVDNRVNDLEEAVNWYINDDGYLVIKLDSYINDDGYLVIA